MIRAAKNFAAKVASDGTEERYVPNPARWLDEERWKDAALQVEPPKATDKSGWEQWHHELNQHLPDAAILSWIIHGRRHGEALIFADRKKAVWVRERYDQQLRRVGIFDVRMEDDKTPAV